MTKVVTGEKALICLASFKKIINPYPTNIYLSLQCCLLLRLLHTAKCTHNSFLMEAKTMDPDQTASKSILSITRIVELAREI